MTKFIIKTIYRLEVFIGSSVNKYLAESYKLRKLIASEFKEEQNTEAKEDVVIQKTRRPCAREITPYDSKPRIGFLDCDSNQQND